MRAIVGAIAGIIVAIILNPSNHSVGYGVVFSIGIIFYIISYIIAKKMTYNIKSEDKRKLATNGIMPYIFMLLMFMIITYTGLNGSIK